MPNGGSGPAAALLLRANIHLMGHERCQGCFRKNFCFGKLQGIFGGEGEGNHLMFSKVMDLYRKGKRVKAPPAWFGKPVPPRVRGGGEPRWPHRLDAGQSWWHRCDSPVMPHSVPAVTQLSPGHGDAGISTASVPVAVAKSQFETNPSFPAAALGGCACCQNRVKKTLNRRFIPFTF